MATIPSGIATVPSSYSLEVTLSKLKTLIESKGLTIFAHIDHGAGATQVGLTMQPAHVLIFGTAKAGTPVMVSRPLLALDLPLKVLVSEDAEKKVWVSYNTAEFLSQRYDIPAELLKNIAGVPVLVQAALATPA
jgi:uncharacterized protein (DUF302 family)